MSKLIPDPESIRRWQDKHHDEKSKAINLFITLSVATFGFLINQFSHSDFQLTDSKSRNFIGAGAILLLVCIIEFLLLLLFRINGFSKVLDIFRAEELTPEVSKKIKVAKRIERTTQILFNVGVCMFGISEALLIVGFYFHLNLFK